MELQTKIHLEIKDSIAYILLKPKLERHPPLLDQAVMRQFSIIIEQIQCESDIRLVVLKSESTKFFCCGADINVLKDLNKDSFGSWVILGNHLMRQIEELAQPILAIVNGFALGGGLELALACDFIYAGPNAKFGLTEAKIGMIPGWGGHYRLADRIGLAKAREMVYRSKIIDNIQAGDWGLANQVFQSEGELQSELGKCCKEIIDNVSVAVQKSKYIFHQHCIVKEGMLASEFAEARFSIELIQKYEVSEAIGKFLNSKN